MISDYDEHDRLRAKLAASLIITRELGQFSDSKDVIIILGAAICTWCTRNGYSPQEVILELCNNTCDIQDMLDGLNNGTEIGGKND